MAEIGQSRPICFLKLLWEGLILAGFGDDTNRRCNRKPQYS